MKKNNLKKIIVATLFIFITLGCNNRTDENSQSSSDEETTELNETENEENLENVEIVKDHEGSKYKTVTIGNQIWISENLNTSYFNNGEKIPEAKTVEEWAKAFEEGKPAWCYYENTLSNGEKYGKLYNWYVLKDSRGISPNGWHLPSCDEFKQMRDEFGGLETSGLHLKSTTSWCKRYSGEEGNGTNNSGFSGLAGGYRDSQGNFSSLTKEGYWWSSTNVTDRLSNSGNPTKIVGHEGSEDKFAYPLNISSNSNYGSSANPWEIGYGFSVRLIKDN